MEKMENKIDFKKHPYRGILSEIAKSTGRKRQNIKYALEKGNPEICGIFVNKLEERRNNVCRYKSIVG